MEQWEYKIKEIIMEEGTVKTTGFWGNRSKKIPHNVSWKRNKMITEPIENIEKFEEQFNDLGEEGWELCGINRTGNFPAIIYFIFKRKKIN